VLYVAVALRSLRRYSTYRAATLAGAFTNSVFGIIIAFVYLAVWKQNPTAGGYDASDAVTYCWLAQALIATVAVWSGGTTDDVAQRIRTGDIAIDLYRPVSLLGWYLASDLGRAVYHLVSRGAVPVLIGALLFDVHFPSNPLTYVAFLVAVLLGVTVSFAIRMLVACSAFWLVDQTGVLNLSAVFAMFLSGLAVPLVLFPGWTRDVVLALPWSSYMQVPIDVWLGKSHGVDLVAAYAFSAAWAAVLLGLCAFVLRLADRKVVVHGG
jgi:ABC-2 type transport system permease protein